MSKGWRVAVLGATGLVGDTMISVLEERDFPVSELYPLASNRSLGKTVKLKGKSYPVLDVETFDFSKADIGLFSAGAEVSAKYAPIAAAAGCVVIDNTSQFRYQDDIPLVVPEVNPKDIAQFRTHGIIANPNCSTIQMLVALKPLHDAAGITRINVATYQSVSGAGKEAVDELAHQTAELLQGRPVTAKVIAKQIAFNCVPQIDKFQDNGYTKEEMKMFWETQKIMGDKSIQVNATAVRVPVFFGHSEVINIETRKKLSAAEARRLLENAPGITVMDEHVPGGYPTAATEAANHDTVYVGRIREDISHERGLNLWVVSDNVRKGAATNSVQIAEILVREYL
ncbi:MAG: aspartate-semialdehyde dehydrogenase [Proteobacteria bacterium]|jgi:aspartate-semialdehyde dehydrogenase|nr:aspartate-semialdehyde dehydrogenase [Pseudomonadota bacterium]MBK7114793.1 aspartate-semialdehyde dehydrogenase [Pseudomonadota bacterium]MCC6632764.1 aspartate-semialdehyde dehydrogenase [Gammaproteobacteria bacterium]